MLLLLFLLASDIEMGDAALPREVVAIDQPPATTTHDVVGLDSIYVSVVDDHVKVSDRPVQRRPGKTPREVSDAVKYNVRAVATVHDGWLVGVDAGEFGGELWWVRRYGIRAVRIQIPPTKAIDDPFAAENVVALVEFQGRLLAFVGLDHLGGRSGRIFDVECREDHCTTRLVTVLDGSPRDWVAVGDHLLILTGSGIWDLLPAEQARLTYTFNTPWWLRPTSIARLSNGVLYVGMEHFILRLQQVRGEWHERWFEVTRSRED